MDESKEIQQAKEEKAAQNPEGAQPDAETVSTAGETKMLFDFAAEQKAHNRKMQRLMTITAGCMIGILAVVVLAAALILPRALGILSDVQAITTQVQEMADQAETVLTDAQEIVSQVKEGNPRQLMDSLNSLARESETAMLECVEQVTRAVDILDKMDIDSLNTAVDNLGQAIAPLAKLFGGR